MNDIRIEGFGSISGGEYNNVRIDGVGSSSGSIKSESLRVDGTFHCSGSIDTGFFDCNGAVNIRGDVKAKKIDIDGALNIKGPSKIEAEEIICDGAINIDGQVSADVIRADGLIKAREIVGDNIRINSHLKGFFFGFGFGKYSNIDLIEATTINLSGVTAMTVNGSNIVIGPGCRITNIDCNGTLFIDHTSIVDNITGDYKRA